METVVFELTQPHGLIERYVDSLYALKFQRRTGWGDETSEESVAAHSYSVMALARALIPDSNEDKLRVLELLRFHDLGEAIVSDIPKFEKRYIDEQNEERVVNRIALLGALTQSSDMLAMRDAFMTFESESDSEAVRIAQDFDRLELLIQFHRFKRAGRKISNEVEFEKYVQPARFSTSLGKDFASRFQTYFSQSTHLTSDLEMQFWGEGVAHRGIGRGGLLAAELPG